MSELTQGKNISCGNVAVVHRALEHRKPCETTKFPETSQSYKIYERDGLQRSPRKQLMSGINGEVTENKLRFVSNKTSR
jgi:hypothetical protein